MAREAADVVEVLVPDSFSTNQRYRTVYLLSAWGPLDTEALDVVREQDLHNTHDLICVLPRMGGWYLEHPADRQRQSQSYLKNTIVPLIEAQYPIVEGAEGRLLVGFSKSGWGAFSMIFHHPDFYGYAASWDAPLMLGDDKHEWAGGEGLTLEQWRHYHPRDSAKMAAESFRNRARLVHFRGPYWKEHAQPYKEHLDGLGIKYVYRGDYLPEHNWDAKWMVPAFEALVGLTRQPNMEGSRP